MKKAVITLLILMLAQNVWGTETEIQIENKINRIYELIHPVTSIQNHDKLMVNSYTVNRVQAFWLWQSLPVEKQKQLSYIFESPNYYDCLESEKHPLKVCYNSEEELEKAQISLQYSDQAWDEEVSDFGFWAPKKVSDNNEVEVGIDIYLGDAQGAYGYTSPGERDYSTDYVDCASFIVIQNTLEGNDLKSTIYHEFNHSCQLAMDCTETGSSMESTATWLEHTLAPGNDMYFIKSVTAFQSAPQNSIGLFEYQSSYAYGASLFTQFLQEYLGGNDPHYIVKIWEGTVQNAYENEPDLLDSIVNLGEEQDKDLNTIITQFGEWRYFVGKNDDGAHFENGDSWLGTEVYVSKNYDFYVDRHEFSDDIDIQQFGYYYANITIDSEDLPEGKLIITGKGSSKSVWDMEAWLLNNNKLQKKMTTLAEMGNSSEILINSEEFYTTDRIILMIANLGKDVDWDQTWREQPFNYTIDYLILPQIKTVTPDKIMIGQQVDLTITGENFDPQANVEITGDGIEIVSTDIDTSEINLTIKVSQDAQIGKRDIIVNNYETYEGFESVLEEGIEIVKPDGPQITALEPAKGYPGDNFLARVEGENFSDGVNFEFSCNEIVISNIQYVNETTMYINLAISDGAEEKSCDLTATDIYEQSSTLTGGFSIIAEEKLFEAGGGGCSIGLTQNSRQKITGLLGALFLLSLLLRMRNN